MLYLIKRAGDADAIDDFYSLSGNRQDFSDYYNIFNFSGFIHRSQKEKLQTMREESMAMVADIMASHLAILYQSEMLKRELIVRESLRCCRDINIDQGFDEPVDEREIVQLGTQTETNIVLVPGCQTQALLDYRVQAIVKLSSELISSFAGVEIVFSGSNPGSPSSKIQNESRRMRQMFWQRWESNIDKVDIQKLMKVDTLVESKASTSIQNIKKFVEAKNQSLRKPCNVFLVSSNFHLIRLAQAMLAELGAHDNLQVKSLVLVGSEQIERPDVVSTSMAYVRSMFYEIYDYMLKRSDFWTQSK